MLRRILCSLVVLLLVSSTLHALEDRVFDSDGVKIHYFVDGEGEPIVLIHGFSANALVQWGLPGIFRDLAKDHQVIALDVRGHGRSDKPHDADQYGVKMVEDVVRLLDHRQIPKAHIVGYSMGGFITSKLLTTYPDRVASATLGGAGWSRADDRRLAFLDNLAQSLEAGEGITPLLVHLNPPGRNLPGEDALRNINRMVMAANDPQALAAVIRGIKGLSVPEEKLKENKVPTLALIGELDPLKIGVDEMQQRMTNLKVSVIDDADHMSATRDPKFLREMKTFLAEHRFTEAKDDAKQPPPPRPMIEPPVEAGAK